MYQLARLTRHCLPAIALALISMSLAVPAAATDPVNKTFFGDQAIKGYDVVAYHQEGKPIKGNKKISHAWQGANWLFSSTENRDRFAADPAAYAPQYGGYCAYAVSQGYTADIDPKAWKILDGKLYLNYNAKIQQKWERDTGGYIGLADGNWPKILADD